MKRTVILLGFLMLLGFLFWKRTAHPGELQGSAMGVRWSLEWRGKGPPRAELKREIVAVLEHWEQVLSQWRPTSDLSRYNRGEAMTPDLARVLSLAEGIKTATGGAFDPYLLGKVHAAGFGPAGEGIDLSSIGKGFAADRVGERLRELGVNDFVFALAGEVLAGDEAWPVDIEEPRLDGRSIATTVQLKRRAIATSGNYRQFRLTDEGLVTHIIDPATGRSVMRPPSSVTVMAGDCATASAWATALFVRGPGFKDYPAELEVSWRMDTPRD
jgi:thiamine biosynthesis lipoprotein